MRRFSLSMAVLALVMYGARADEPSSETAKATAGAVPSVSKEVALVRVGFPDEALVERIRKYVEYQTAIPVHLHPAREPQGRPLYDEGSALSDTVETRDLCLVALVWPAAESADHAVYLYDQHIGVVNARVLKTDAEDEEVYARRLERLVMRSIGLLLELQPVPNPQSVLFPYANLKELDQIGRNYDPPTLVKLQQAAKAHGVTDWVEDSPYFLWMKK